MSVTAKWANICPNCRVRFVIGKDQLTKDNKSGKWVHVDCSEAARYSKSQSELVGKTYSTSLAGRNVPQEIDTDKLVSFLEEAEERQISEAYIKNAINEGNEIQEEKQSFIPSKYQQDIFDGMISMVDGSADYKHLVIEAVAGSGKTTTLLEGISKILEVFPDLNIRIVAFNKHIANEFEKRLPDGYNAHASTMHSLGLSAIRKINSKVKVDNDKVGTILDDIYPVSRRALEDGLIDKKQRQENFSKRLSMRNLVSICKSILVDVEDGNAVMEAIERYGIDIDDQFTDELIAMLPTIIETCKKNMDVVDFDDMPWLPIALDLNIEKFDILMVDEAQDLSIGNIQFLMKCVKDDGHIVAVGDRNQSLYGFRGADTDAIPNIINTLNATVLPLSVTYRCPTSHVENVKHLVPQIEARDNAPEGSIEYVEYLNLASLVQDADMVVCRTNAPLIKPAFECIRMGKKAIIRGKDIGQSLIALIKRFETNDLGQFEVSLHEYFVTQYNRMLDKGKEMQALLLQDRVQTLQFIMNECSTVSELLSKIQLLFDDNNGRGVVFSSVHRAKGLEAERVFILRPDLMPHPKAKKSWEAQQERNGIYVAQTRSKNHLYFVNGGENV